MPRKRIIDSIVDGRSNRTWGIIEDTWIDEANKNAAMGLTNFPAINVSEKGTSSEERGLLLLKLPKQPPGAKSIRKIRISLYVIADVGPVAPDQAIYVYKSDLGPWTRNFASWDSRVEFSTIVGGAPAIADWGTDAPTPTTGESDGSMSDAVIAAIPGGRLLTGKYITFDIINPTSLDVASFEWDSVTTLILAFEGGPDGTKDVVFGGNLLSHSDASIPQYNKVPIVKVYYDLESPEYDPTSAGDSEAFLEEDINLELNTDETKSPIPLFTIKPTTDKQGQFEKFMVGIYDEDVRAVTGGRWCFNDNPTYFEKAGEDVYIEPVGQTFTWDAVNQQAVVTDLSGLMAPQTAAVVYTSNIIKMGIDALPGADFGNYRSSSISLERGPIWNPIRFDVLQAITATSNTDGALITSASKPMQRFVVKRHTNEVNEFKVHVVYLNHRNLLTDPTDPALTDPVGFTIEEFNFSNPPPATLTSDYNIHELIHVGIEAVNGTVPSEVVEIRTEDTDELICVIPAGIGGPVYTSIFTDGEATYDMHRILEDAGVILTDAEMDLTKRWYFRVWRRQGNTDLDAPLRSNEITVQLKVADVAAPLLNHNRTPDTGQVGDNIEMLVQFKDPPIDLTHVDFSYFEDEDGDKVFLRVPTSEAELVIAPDSFKVSANHRYQRSGAFPNVYRYYSKSKNFAWPWQIADSDDVTEDATITPRDVACVVNVTPEIARIGEEVTIDLRKSTPGAANVDFSEYRSSWRDQDFTTEDPAGLSRLLITDPSTVHSPATNPMLKHTFTKAELGSMGFPKIVRVRGKVDDGSDTDEAVTEIIINDDVAVDIRDFVTRNTNITIAGEVRQRDSVVQRISNNGHALVDQGFAGMTLRLQGATSGGDNLSDLAALSILHDAQTYLFFDVAERSANGLVRRLKGKLTSGLTKNHQSGSSVTWNADFFVEKEVVADVNGKLVLHLVCGDDVPSGRLGYGVKSTAADVYDTAELIPVSGSLIKIWDPLTDEYWDPVGVIPVGTAMDPDDPMDGDFALGAPTAFTIGAGITGTPDGRFDVYIKIEADREFRILFKYLTDDALSEKYRPTTAQLIPVRGLQVS